jgi:hypothetical protein
MIWFLLSGSRYVEHFVGVNEMVSYWHSNNWRLFVGADKMSGIWHRSPFSWRHEKGPTPGLAPGP